MMGIRALKGIYMFLMFALFGFGIIMAVVFAFPVVLALFVIHGPDHNRMQAVNRWFMGLWLRAMSFGRLLKVEAVQGMPMDKPCVIIANHPGLFDVIALIVHVPKMSVMVKRGLVRKLPLWPIFWSAGYVSAPEKGKLNELSELFQNAKTLLDKGCKFMIFPEGTRSPKGGLHTFRPGAFRLAAMAGVPIQPVVIHNNPPFLPHEDKWYFPPFVCSVIRLQFLDPIPCPEPGMEKLAAAKAEAIFRSILGIEDDKKSSKIQKNHKKEVKYVE